MLTVCIIPARGGSKRIHRKNLADLAGRPLVSYPIATAISSKLFDRVLVSTDDPEIAAVARQAGAEVLDRPAPLADDVSTVDDVCINALDALESKGRQPDLFCCLYATAALVTPDDLIASHKLICEHDGAETLMGVSGYPIHPYKALVEVGGFLTPLFPDEVLLNTQDYPAVVASNGTIYWARVAAYRESRSIYGPACIAYPMPPERAIDVDTPEDLERLRRTLVEQSV